VTIDIFCKDEPTFRQLCAAEPLKPEAPARLYGVAWNTSQSSTMNP
jgi:hypothetical protein